MASTFEQLYSHYTEDKRFQYRLLDKHYKNDAIEVMTKSFCDYEPMTKFINMTYEEFEPFANIIIDKAIEDKLSVVALDGKRIVACTAVEDLIDPAPIDLNKLTPKFKYIFSLLESLSGPYLADKTIDKNHVAHLFITAVHPDYHKRGLSRQINFQSIKVAMQREFDFMLSELTNWYNEKGLIKYLDTRSKLIGRAIYDQYHHEGIYPFKGLTGEAHSYIWQIQDNNQLKTNPHSSKNSIII